MKNYYEVLSVQQAHPDFFGKNGTDTLCLIICDDFTVLDSYDSLSNQILLPAETAQHVLTTVTGPPIDLASKFESEIKQSTDFFRVFKIFANCDCSESAEFWSIVARLPSLRKMI